MFSLFSRNLVAKAPNFSVTRAKACAVNFSNLTHEAPKVVDFGSDAFSLPPQEMREFMVKAKMGTKGFDEDPTRTALEKKVAALFEKEDAVFVITGTMANLASVLVHGRERPSEMILGHMSHMNIFEQMGGAQFGGINAREVKNHPDGTFDVTDVQNLIRTSDLHEPKTSLICVENTHTLYGGKIMPLEWLDEVAKVAKSRGIPLHMDGSRIFNASVRSKIPVSRITRDYDSINVSLSKGLGCPYGSIIVGSKDFISQTKNVIKALGGGIRQIGFTVAAAIYALDNMMDRLQEDHEHVQMIANAIREMDHPYITVSPPDEIHTNILNISVDGNHVTSNDFLDRLGKVSKGGPNVVVNACSYTKNTIRLVSCCNVSKTDNLHAIEKIRWVMNELR